MVVVIVVVVVVVVFVLVETFGMGDGTGGGRRGDGGAEIHMMFASLSACRHLGSKLFARMTTQHDLSLLWKHAPEGRLSPLEQMKAFAMREVMRKTRDGEVNLATIANFVTTEGKPRQHPSREAIRRLFLRLDDDDDWFPGKSYQESFGPKPLMTPAKRKQIASTAMDIKKAGDEPSTQAVIAKCPVSTYNPVTRLPFSDASILDVFKTECYDITPENPWCFQRCLQKTWLPPPIRELRLQWAQTELRNLQPPVWYFNNIIWFDPNHTVIPAGAKKAADQSQLYKGTRRYISNDAKMYSRNLRAPAYAKSQCGWGDRRIRWILLLTRGLIHVEVMPEGWTEDSKGMAMFVERLPGILDRALGKTVPKPKVLFTDRGSAMFTPKTAIVQDAYGAAVEAAGFRLYTGRDASAQPADVADVLLHETAISSFRKLLNKERPKGQPWKESYVQFRARVRRVVGMCNSKYDFQRLCCEYPARLKVLKEKEGDRLRK